MGYRVPCKQAPTHIITRQVIRTNTTPRSRTSDIKHAHADNEGRRRENPLKHAGRQSDPNVRHTLVHVGPTMGGIVTHGTRCLGWIDTCFEWPHLTTLRRTLLSGGGKLYCTTGMAWPVARCSDLLAVLSVSRMWNGIFFDIVQIEFLVRKPSDLDKLANVVVNRWADLLPLGSGVVA